MSQLVVDRILDDLDNTMTFIWESAHKYQIGKTSWGVKGQDWRITELKSRGEDASSGSFLRLALLNGLVAYQCVK